MVLGGSAHPEAIAESAGPVWRQRVMERRRLTELETAWGYDQSPASRSILRVVSEVPGVGVLARRRVIPAGQGIAGRISPDHAAEVWPGPHGAEPDRAGPDRLGGSPHGPARLRLGSDQVPRTPPAPRVCGKSTGHVRKSCGNSSNGSDGESGESGESGAERAQAVGGKNETRPPAKSRRACSYSSRNSWGPFTGTCVTVARHSFRRRRTRVC